MILPLQEPSFDSTKSASEALSRIQQQVETNTAIALFMNAESFNSLRLHNLRKIIEERIWKMHTEQISSIKNLED
jgi:cell fate (sporulation/competence/biofilm development) regulator YlbF (YheA/YmcA/DUF963 family)